MTNFHLRGTGLEDHSLLNEEQVVKKNNKNRGSIRRFTRRLKAWKCWCLVAFLSAMWLTFFGLWMYCNYFMDNVDVPTAVGRNREADLVVLPHTFADKTGSYCLDGTPPSYYFRNASSEENQTSWIVHLHGSSFCYNLSSCAQRSTTQWGSSQILPVQQEFHGILSADFTVNPDFYDWNVVIINYCDGAAFSGNRDEPVVYNNTKMYYRGMRVLEAVINYLLQSAGMADADQILLTGESAGGLAVYLHADHISSMISDETRFKAMADGGFFLDEADIDGRETWRSVMKGVYDMQYVKGSLDEDCLLAKGTSNKWECFFPEYAYPYVTTPLFVINSVYDPWVQCNILKYPCHPSECNETIGYLEKHRETFMQRTDQVKRYDKDGMFVSSCYTHCQAVADTPWRSYKVAGATTRQAFAEWYFDMATPGGYLSVDCDSSHKCNPTCAATWTLGYNVSYTRMSR